jgi:aspartyl-tRNA(Asn)/glutamyl-tRNA(Gln) amidotransferase subunit A
VSIFITEIDPVGGGPRLAVKDLFDTAGVTTTYGSILFVDHVPARTATAVQRLLDAGYGLAGKTNLHEFAYGVTSQNVHFGTVPNPAAPGRIAGGSSGGSAAALAAGLADLALGSDSGGSIRIPSACCGTVGFKPTYDLVPIDGCFPLAPSFDHAGPMAKDVAGCVELLGALVPGFEPQEVALEELRVGVAWTEDADPLVRERVEAAAAQFPNRRRVEFPRAETTSPLFMREVADVHRELIAENADAYGPRVRKRIENCLLVTDAEVEAARRAREEHRERVDEALAGLDLLLTPTVPHVAPPDDVDELAVLPRMISCTYAFNALGWPALALPCGTAEEGLPASVQLAGRGGTDALVLGAGIALEASLDRGRARA